jgi:hypothetical protein
MAQHAIRSALARAISRLGVILLLGCLSACGLYDPWQIRLDAESWTVLDGQGLRLHYKNDDWLLDDPAKAQSYLESGEAFVEMATALFGGISRRIDVYQFSDQEHWNEIIGTFGEAVGAANPHHALGPEPQIFLVGYEDLGHEIIHVMSQGLGQPPPALFYEGLAVTYGGIHNGEFHVPAGTASVFAGRQLHSCAQSWVADDYMPHHVVSYWQKLTIDENGFYCLSGSFVKYLIDTYGLSRFLIAFREGGRSQLLGNSVEVALHSAYGKTMETLEEEWRAQLY